MQKNHLREADAALAAATQVRLRAQGEYRRTLLGDLAEAARKCCVTARCWPNASRNPDIVHRPSRRVDIG